MFSQSAMKLKLDVGKLSHWHWNYLLSTGSSVVLLPVLFLIGETALCNENSELGARRSEFANHKELLKDSDFLLTK